jgi:cytochrome c-type biogenesis protein CcmH/NrfG
MGHLASLLSFPSFDPGVGSSSDPEVAKAVAGKSASRLRLRSGIGPPENDLLVGVVAEVAVVVVVAEVAVVVVVAEVAVVVVVAEVAVVVVVAEVAVVVVVAEVAVVVVEVYVAAGAVAADAVAARMEAAPMKCAREDGLMVHAAFARASARSLPGT